MGFKIESIAEISNIANTITSDANVIEGFGASVKSSLEELPSIVVGQNIEVTLRTFEQKVSDFLALVSAAEKKVSSFIASQALGYAENEETINSELSKISEEFKNISFE